MRVGWEADPERRESRSLDEVGSTNIVLPQWNKTNVQAHHPSSKQTLESHGVSSIGIQSNHSTSSDVHTAELGSGAGSLVYSPVSAHPLLTELLHWEDARAGVIKLMVNR